MATAAELRQELEDGIRDFLAEKNDGETTVGFGTYTGNNVLRGKFAISWLGPACGTTPYSATCTKGSYFKTTSTLCANGLHVNTITIAASEEDSQDEAGGSVRETLARHFREFLAEGIDPAVQVAGSGDYTGNSVIHVGNIVAWKGPDCGTNPFTARLTPGSGITGTTTKCPQGGWISKIHIA